MYFLSQGQQRHSKVFVTKEKMLCLKVLTVTEVDD
jgi:hypothetical protein